MTVYLMLFGAAFGLGIAFLLRWAFPPAPTLAEALASLNRPPAPTAILGAHTGGFNTDTFGVSVLGNLDVARPSAATVRCSRWM